MTEHKMKILSALLKDHIEQYRKLIITRTLNNSPKQTLITNSCIHNENNNLCREIVSKA